MWKSFFLIFVCAKLLRKNLDEQNLNIGLGAEG